MSGISATEKAQTMMTSSNGNIFRVTGHLWEEFTGPRWILHTKASDAEFDVYFDMRPNKRLSKQSWGWWFQRLSHPFWRHRNGNPESPWIDLPIPPIPVDMRQWSKPSLVQIMACSMPSHYLNQCWLIVNSTQRNKRQWKFNRSLSIFILENTFENVLHKMAATLFWPVWDKLPTI